MKHSRVALVAIALVIAAVVLTVSPALAGLPSSADQAWGASTSDQVGASIDLSGDFNNDGLADALISAPGYSSGNGQVRMYLGVSGSVPSTTATWTVGASTNEGFGTVAIACNVNGDSYDDVVVTAPYHDESGGAYDVGAVTVYLGSSGGLATSASWSFYGTQNYENMGTGMTCVGDIQNDGYEDLAVGAANYDNGGVSNIGRVVVFYGSTSGLPSSPSWSYTSTNSNFSQIGLNFTLAGGDINNDGYDDLAIGIPNYGNMFNPQSGLLYVYRGSSSGLTSTGLASYAGSAGGHFLGKYVKIGDGNNDNINDLLFSENTDGVGTWKVLAYAGSTSGLNTSTPFWQVAIGSAGGKFDVIGDTNGDTYNDVLTTNGNYAYLFYGASTAPSTSSGWSYDTTATNPYAPVASGDTDGDGLRDVLISNASYQYYTQNEGRAWLFKGRPEPITSFYVTYPTDVHPGTAAQFVMHNDGTMVTYSCSYSTPAGSWSSTAATANMTFNITLSVSCTASNSVSSQNWSGNITLK